MPPKDRNRGTREKLPVSKDTIALQASEWSTGFMMNIFERTSPGLFQELVVLAQKNKTAAIGIITVVMEAVGHFILPFFPGKIQDITVDFLAKTPGSISHIVDDYAKRPVPAGVQVTEADANRIQREMMDKLVSYFNRTVGVPLILIRLMERSAGDGINYLRKLNLLMKEIDPHCREIIRYLVSNGETEKLISLLQSSSDEQKAFCEAFLLLRPKTFWEKLTDTVGGSEISDADLDEIACVWEEPRQKLGLPSLRASASNQTTEPELTTHLIITSGSVIIPPGEITEKERRKYGR